MHDLTWWLDNIGNLFGVLGGILTIVTLMTKRWRLAWLIALAGLLWAFLPWLALQIKPAAMPTPAPVVNNTTTYVYATSSVPVPESPIKKAHAAIDPLKADQTLGYFEQQLGPAYSDNTNEPWYDTDVMPPQMYYQFVFKGYLSADPKSVYYIQAVTPSNSDEVVFWSMTVCDPNTTFSITDPSSGKMVTLNSSTFADIIKISDNPIGDDDQESPTLHYFNWGNQDIYETEDEFFGDRLYVGVNNSCSIYDQMSFPFRTASGTFITDPQFLQDVSNTPDLANFRQTTKINTIGMSGWNDSVFYYYLQDKSSQASMGYDFLTAPIGN